jgi:hypothetical protein
MVMSKWQSCFGWIRPTRRPGRRQRRLRPRSVGTFELLEPRTLLSASPIVLGPQTGFFDQPHVDIEMYSGETGIGPYGSAFGLGIYPYNHFLLDTGANAILSAREATLDLESNGYQTDGTFLEQGVAGVTEFDVSAPYRLDFTGTDGVIHTLSQTADQVRILSSDYVELGASIADGGFAGIVGMPAMAGSVTSLDFSAWGEAETIWELLPMEVTFSEGPDALPPDNGHRYSVAVDDRVSFEPEDGLPPNSPPNAPLPTWAPVPFMTGVAGYQGNHQSGNFLLDTGAQMSMISESMAFAIGLDENGDGNFQDEMLYSIEVSGVGGTIEVPVLLIDSLSLPTEQGADLVWTGTDPDELGLEMIVLDITEGLDGVFGVDLLTSGLTFDIDPVTLEIIMEGAAYFDQVYFDFRDMMAGTGTIYFDLHPHRVHINQSGGSTDVAVDDDHPENAFLVFTPSNWDTPQVVRVTAVDDVLIERAHSGAITHSASSADDHYDGIRVSMVTANITDDDVAYLDGQYVFYNNSNWDDPLEGRNDGDAIAPDKTALLPGGTASFENYTSYSRGINGIIVDVFNLENPAVLDAADFQFKVGNDDDPQNWSLLTAVPTVDVHAGQGPGIVDRVVLTWEDNAIQNQWMEVTVLAGDNTGLPADEVFYFGNAVGETGDSTTDARVDANDILQTRNNPHPFFDPAPINGNHDFDRDERVDAIDTLIVRNHQTTFFNELKLIDLSGGKTVGGDELWTRSSTEQNSPPPLIWLDNVEAAAGIHRVLAHDAILGATDEHLGDCPDFRAAKMGMSPSGILELTWLYELEQTGRQQRSSKNDSRVELELLHI